MTTSTNRLFQLTTNRKLILSAIITRMNQAIESKEVDSFSWLCIDNHPTLTDEEKQNRFDALKKEWETFCLYHDVLETIACHTNETNRTIFMKQTRPWKTEWDIPLELFNETINSVTQFIETKKERSQPKFQADYDEQLSLLAALKSFRNTGS